jgi:hypothetical protein
MWMQFSDGTAVPGTPHDGRVGQGPEMEVVVSKESWDGGGGAGMAVAGPARWWRRR